MIDTTMFSMEAFQKWLFEVCRIKSEATKGRITLHDIYPTLDMTDAKLAFADGQTPEQYSQEI